LNSAGVGKDALKALGRREKAVFRRAKWTVRPVFTSVMARV
jgi:hypothetical protein